MTAKIAAKFRNGDKLLIAQTTSIGGANVTPNSLRNATSGSPARMRGMTTIGVIILIMFIGMFAYAGIQLTPVYLNYMKVAGVVEGIKEEFDGQNPTVGGMRRSIERRFSIESVAVITAKDIKITPESGGYLVDATYDHKIPYLANVSFSVHFEKQATVRR